MASSCITIVVDCRFDVLVIDGAVGHRLQSLSLVLGEGSLPQDQMTKQAPPRAGGKRVQTSLLQLCERRLLLYVCSNTIHKKKANGLKKYVPTKSTNNTSIAVKCIPQWSRNWSLFDLCSLQALVLEVLRYLDGLAFTN